MRVRARLWTAAGLAAGAVLASCGGGDVTTVESPGTTTQQQPPAADDAPPPVGDGEGGARLELVGEFDMPVYVTEPASGDDEYLYVVEQCGTIQRLPIAGGEAETFLDIGDLVTCEGEQGLLSMAFASDYERSGRFYVNYTDTAGDSRTVEYRRSADDPGVADPDSARELLRIEDFAPNHNGGLLLFGPDERLYLGMGDGGGSGDPERTAQDPSRPLGKLLVIDAENPGEYELAALGLRNPWRFSFDRETDDLWIGDVGQDEVEEIDAVASDELGGKPLNFGWSAFEGSERFNGDQEAPDAIPPVFEYPREGDNCSVTGGYVVRDPELASLYGRYLYGDFCAGELRSFVGGPGRPARDDVALGLRVDQLSSFGEDAAGRLYATSLGGPVYRLEAD